MLGACKSTGVFSSVELFHSVCQEKLKEEVYDLYIKKCVDEIPQCSLT